MIDAERTFKAMADGTRRRILQLLARHELGVSEIVDSLAQPQSTVSRHLKVLRQAGLIEDRREGTTILYAPVRGEADDASSDDLAGRIIEWASGQALPAPLRRRLERVLDRRRDRSTEFFSRVGRRWDRMRVEAFGDTFHRDALAALLPADWVVADIGTGTGYMLPILARTFRKVIAVDPVENMLEVARSRCRAEGIKNVAFRRGDLSRLPILNRQADLVLAMLVLHHVPSPPDALLELHRVVKPGGHLLIVEQRSHRFEAFHERMRDRWWGFEPSRLARNVTQAGFRDVRCRALASEPSHGASTEAPELFTVTACRQRSGGDSGNRRTTRATHRTRC